MTAPLFLAGSVDGDVLVLDGPEGHHAAAVRRLAAGEHVSVADGRGTLASCVVTAVSRDTVTLAVESRVTEPEPRPRLVVVQALAKGDRAEDAVEAMTEVGVDEIVPWAAERSVVRWEGARGERSLERWRATAREASKQSRRARVPEIAPLATTSDVADRLARAALPVVLHEAATAPLAALDPPRAGEVVVVVGPEGGIADEELAVLAAPPYRLGPGVLRTSTAGVVAAAVLLSRTGRWGTGPGR